MDALTIEQRQHLLSTYAFIRTQLNGRPAEPAALAQALTAVFPAADPSEAEGFLTRVQAGGERFRKAYAASGGDDGLPQPAGIAACLTKDLDAQQRKGLYLQSCEFMRQYHAACGIAEAEAAGGPPDLATLEEAELQALFTEQLTVLSEGLAQEFSGPPAELPDPLSYAAAVFAAAGNGDLPAYYARSPELLGACLAAGQTLSGLPDADRQQAAVSVIAVLAAVAVTILVAALVVPAILPAAAAADAALAGLAQQLMAALPAIATEGGGFFLLRLLLGLVGTLGTTAALAAPFAAGALTYAAAERIRRFYRERLTPRQTASAKPQPAVRRTADTAADPATQKA